MSRHPLAVALGRACAGGVPTATIDDPTPFDDCLRIADVAIRPPSCSARPYVQGSHD